MSDDSDAALAALVLDGDDAAAAVLVRRYQRAVFGICLRMMGRREDAEDVTQEAFLRLFRHLDRWDASRPLRPWLMTIAVNRCRTALSRRGRQRALLPGDLDPADTSVPLTDADLAEELQRAVDGLRDDHRAAFVLFHYEELSLQEVGAALGRPDGTVKTWLHRARKQLAEALARRGVQPDQRSAPPAPSPPREPARV
ncbi:RNA polymerase sigma factor [Alienimonas californiensis]|uniref:ECF RNA polymerase sigma factor SigE n=1 Tax=Alienimonas californiensis TaxID=2527989 RepID=A0A517PDD5_9PLAN|nr:sigma-70 family RNA polymerase sigma factor [Alienimonas californiensis]QDT17389.1 ECF RNA polymerase sigma factor SigE [Alienimonas californiensis]